jgi:hypothetical protein
MNSNELQINLSQFIGTEKFCCITHRHLLTDGGKYLTKNAQCFCLMYAITSHLPKQNHDYFAVANLTVKNSSAQLTLDDGNGNIHVIQVINYTDFLLDEVKLYCPFDGEYWVIMLPSEY